MYRRLVLVTAVLAALATTAGCAYLGDRGRDAMDMFQIGITVSSKPYFGLYQDYFNLIPHGYSRVKGKYIGIGARQIGILDFDQRTWGAIVWGSKQWQIGEFNPYDPHWAWQSDIRALKEAGRPLPERTQRYNDGIVRMVAQGNPPPWPTFTSCMRNIHLGYIGIYASLSPLDIVDFVLGWTTLDIMGDDKARPVKKEPDAHET